MHAQEEKKSQNRYLTFKVEVFYPQVQAFLQIVFAKVTKGLQCNDMKQSWTLVSREQEIYTLFHWVTLTWKWFLKDGSVSQINLAGHSKKGALR